jgi:hypothetical protein
VLVIDKIGSVSNFSFAPVLAEEPNRLPILSLLLSQDHPSSGYSSNCSGPRTEMEIAYDKIPVSYCLFQSLK